MSSRNGVERLCEAMKILRGPNGCPWDREQTVESLKPCLLEETYELLAAMDSDDVENHLEELGDVLLQIVFQCQIRDEEGKFSFDDVAGVLADKLIRRHPHVFGDEKVDTSGEVLKNWEKIKQTEKKSRPDYSAIDGVPAALPALLKAQRIQAKASRVGFDWADSAGALAKVREEFEEVAAELTRADQGKVEEEIGDLLFSLVNVCRFHHVDAEDALRRATDKFARRFRAVEKRIKEQARDMRDCTLSELDAVWDEVKADEKN